MEDNSIKCKWCKHKFSYKKKDAEIHFNINLKKKVKCIQCPNCECYISLEK